jgi:serine/threonine protein kinase
VWVPEAGVGGELPGNGYGFFRGLMIAGYRIEEQIGAGGMAVVFRAVDENLDRTVALKVLSPGLAANTAFRKRFMRESKAAAKVDDPHLIPVYNAGEAAGSLFIAMKLVTGGDVRSLVLREGAMSAARAADIVWQVASALDAAHDAGLVHRDVKPANILLEARPGRPDHAYLTDFGICRPAQPSTVVTKEGEYPPGTPAYAAPEQMLGAEVDGRADQYALACAAFELLSGKLAFAQDSEQALLYAKTHRPPPSLRSRRPELAPAADPVLARALAKAPDDRYTTCQEFANALRGALGRPPYDSGALEAATGQPVTRLAVAPGPSPYAATPGRDLPSSATNSVLELGLPRGPSSPTPPSPGPPSPTPPSPGPPSPTPPSPGPPSPGPAHRRRRRAVISVISVVCAAAIIVTAAYLVRLAPAGSGSPRSIGTPSPSTQATNPAPTSTRSKGPTPSPTHSKRAVSVSTLLKSPTPHPTPTTRKRTQPKRQATAEASSPAPSPSPVITSPAADGPLNDNQSIEASPVTCGFDPTDNGAFNFGAGLVGTAEPATSMSLPAGSSDYFYVGSDAGGNPLTSISWNQDLSVTAAYNGNEAVSIGQATSGAALFDSGSTTNVAIAGLGVTGYQLVGSPVTASASTGTSVSLNVTTGAKDLLLIVAGGEGVGLLQEGGPALSTLLNVTYSECGSNVIASAGMFAAFLPAGTSTVTLSGTTYPTDSGTSMGLVAYVLAPRG